MPPTSPPIPPATVFLGLIFGQSFFPPIIEPNQYANVSLPKTGTKMANNIAKIALYL